MHWKTPTTFLAATLLAAGSAFGQSQVNKDEVRAIVAEAMADAQTRSSLLAGADAGHDGKFFIAGDDFRLNVGGYVQFRYLANFRDEDSSSDDFESGFQTRRTKLIFDGNIHRDWGFKIQGNFDRDGGSFGLEDAYASYKFDNGWTAHWGQGKLPLLREENISASHQLAIERSQANEFFNQGRSQGFCFSNESDERDWRFTGAFSDGLNTANTDFTSASEADYAFTGRFDWKGAGSWSAFQDFTSPQGSDTAWMIGVAGHFQQSRNTPAFGDTDVQTFQYTVDASLEGDGWNAFGAFIGRSTDAESFSGDTEADDFGAVVQAGYRFSETTELFARWDGIFVDSDTVASGADDNFSFLTVGLNQYYAGHAAKGSIDFVWSFDDSGDLSTLPDTGTGLLGDTEDGEVTIRLQFQLMF